MNYKILHSYIKILNRTAINALSTIDNVVVSEFGNRGHVKCFPGSRKQVQYICDLHNAEIKALEQTFNNVNVI